MLNDLLTLHYQRDHTGLIDNLIEVRKDDTGTLVSDQRWDYAYDGLKRLSPIILRVFVVNGFNIILSPNA